MKKIRFLTLVNTLVHNKQRCLLMHLKLQIKRRSKNNSSVPSSQKISTSNKKCLRAKKIESLMEKYLKNCIVQKKHENLSF